MALQDEWLSAYAADAQGAREDAPTRSCATMAAHEELLEQFPVFRRLQSDLEREIDARMREPMAFGAEDPITIPVVVHAVWHDNAENISQAQIDSQIDVLNADFSAANPDRANIPLPWRGLSSNSGIRFRLANRDPSGAPHSGVTRTQTAKQGFTKDNSVKWTATGGIDAWPCDQYLNLWVCNLTDYLGYAQFPGGPPATDGVVIRYPAFGSTGTLSAPYDQGRTATHEVGHWLNLIHIWGDTQNCTGSDQVADTPGQRLPNYGTPVFPSISCGNSPNGDMFMNYMDYVDDIAMFMFTSGQVARMQATLQSIRSGLLSSPAIV